MATRGVLLINLGTPSSPSVADVRRYLREFLSDPRVLDVNAALRWLLVNLIIVPFRGPRSARIYRTLWDGSRFPLLHHGQRLLQLLRERLGRDWEVELAMRYGEPSISRGLERLRQASVASITALPLFPQYASCTVGSVHQQLHEQVSSWEVMPELRLVSQFHVHPGMVRAFAERGQRYEAASYDHVLFSFHGIPQRQILAADASSGHCLASPGCCLVAGDHNRFCYRAQCHRTAEAIASQLGLATDRYTVTFQSRLGRQRWATPYTMDTIERLASTGAKRLLVFCPSFVADCLETTYEIAVEANEHFRAVGGEQVQLVEGLNDSREWIEALADLVTGPR